MHRDQHIGYVCILTYRYDDDYIEVLITMHGSTDYDFVLVESMGFVRSYDPRTHSGDHQTIVFVSSFFISLSLSLFFFCEVISDVPV